LAFSGTLTVASVSLIQAGNGARLVGGSLLSGGSPRTLSHCVDSRAALLQGLDRTTMRRKLAQVAWAWGTRQRVTGCLTYTLQTMSIALLDLCLLIVCLSVYDYHF